MAPRNQLVEKRDLIGGVAADRDLIGGKGKSFAFAGAFEGLKPDIVGRSSLSDPFARHDGSIPTSYLLDTLNLRPTKNVRWHNIDARFSGLSNGNPGARPGGEDCHKPFNINMIQVV